MQQSRKAGAVPVYVYVILLAALLALLTLAVLAVVPGRDTLVMPGSQDAETRAGYLNVSDDWFPQEQNMTRAELAQVLSGVAAGVPRTFPRFQDVPCDAWYAPAVQKAAGLGLMSGADGAFRPAEPATRAECADALARLLPSDVWGELQTFPDVPADHWAYLSIARTAACGLLQADSDGLFHPDDGLKRQEAEETFNRLLDCSLGPSYDQSCLRTISNASVSRLTYGDIMETALVRCPPCAGDCLEEWICAASETVLEPEPESTRDPRRTKDPKPAPIPLSDGPHRIDGRLYWVLDGEFVRDRCIGNLYFDEEGRYTTENEELDERLNAIVEELTDDSMTRDEKMRTLFCYIRDNYTYLKRPLISAGQTGWEADYALFFLTNGRGNCHNFAATFCLLCRELGLPAYTVVGQVLNGPHGWVEIKLDGTVYMFDPQLEWRYLRDWGRVGYNFFKMSPYSTPVLYTRY